MVTKISTPKRLEAALHYVRVSARIAGFAQDVHGQGLDSALQKIGFGPLRGKTLKEIVDFLLIYFADAAAGMDEIAANLASCQVLEEIAKNCSTPDDLEEKLKTMVDDNDLTQMTCLYYGIYLYEHLAQRFEEKITQLRGDSVSYETFRMIREDVINRVKEINKTKPLSTINWKSKAGKQIQETIFSAIIQIFEYPS